MAVTTAHGLFGVSTDSPWLLVRTDIACHHKAKYSKLNSMRQNLTGKGGDRPEKSSAQGDFISNN
ncbi:hypothetical protein MSTE_03606 [Mycobacteroides stephanolepidis]|uniref:Uncharacterized protein n=1 Tax=[Mycobacterium] stephanolepidis TaxID=1520670 RepID=A0A1Z4F112_9MYCO|nr:hypothetical protein MSTE_03606 [[Mycobacterium] stephanolepidis]